MRSSIRPSTEISQWQWERDEIRGSLPTAAFRLSQRNTRKPTKNTLTPHATMLAMLANEPSWPSSGMPHDGLTPTGADEVNAEIFLSVSGEERRS